MSGRRSNCPIRLGVIQVRRNEAAVCQLGVWIDIYLIVSLES